MTISTELIRELREKTSAGMMNCKQALQETNGNFEEAIDWLRKKGLSTAAKKVGRIATEGLVHSYIHGTGRIGVLLEINSETDFVARTNEFKDLVHDIAMHIAAASPLSVSADEIPSSSVEREREILIAKAKEQGKKEDMIDRIVDGQIKKWISENCLLEQKFVKNSDLTVKDFLTEAIARIGENIVVRRFVRYELGEGLQKKNENFADEVAAQIKKD